MPITEEIIEPEEDPRFAKVRAIASRDVIGASDRVPVRVITFIVVIGICMTLAPTPANIIGMGATLLLALDTAQHRR